ncbi:dipeptide epimerase [soil metagenome]
MKLREAWAISRESSEEKRYRYVRLADGGGLAGFGEAAHSARYAETEESVQRFLEAVARGHPPDCVSRSGAAAVEMAGLDLEGQRAGIPLHALLGLAHPGRLMTSHSVGLAPPETMASRARSLAGTGFRVLKIKLGTPHDREIIKAVRSATSLPVRADANEGWADREGAARMIDWLGRHDVELVEQPLPAGRLEDVAWLRERSALPLVADEDLPGDAKTDFAALAGAYDGVNIKVMKVGGIRAAMDLAGQARGAGLEVMLGCMIESSLGTTAAAHLGTLARWIDLDGHLLVSNDPFDGLRCDDGHLVLPDRPGIGAETNGAAQGFPFTTLRDR